MRRITVFTNAADTVERLRGARGGPLLLRVAPLDSIGLVPPDHHNVIETDLTDVGHLIKIRQWLSTAPARGEVVFVTPSASEVETRRASAIGATKVLAQPITLPALYRLFGVAPQRPPAAAQPPRVRQAAIGLQDMFGAAGRGEVVQKVAVTQASNAVVHEIEAHGLSSWVDTVKAHHTQTYQHCLLVTGVTVAFGQQLRFSQADRQKLSLAAMLHDVGKAKIPVEILDKPTALDAEEREIMRTHPQHGVDALKGSDFPAEMLDVVLHHHEYIDGTGYPDGLKGSEISDLVRMVTIADVFSALIEERAYKPSLPDAKAYAILLTMGPKLDADLVREFRTALSIAL